MIRSLTFSRSKWSVSSTSRACSRSRLSFVYSPHGRVRIHSRYVRMTPYSAAADGSFSSRPSSRSAALRTSSGKFVERGELLAQLLDLGLLRVAFAELLLDRLQLLSEEVLALALLHLRLHLRLDLRAELEHLELAIEDRRDPPQALLDVDRLEDLLPLLGLDRAQGGRNEVRKRARIVDVRRRELQLLRQVRREPDDAREEPLHVRVSASTSGVSVSRSGSGLNSPSRYGSTSRRCASLTRSRPWTRMRNVPSGTLIILWTRATVPTSYRSSQPGASIDASRAVTSASSRSPETTSSISRTERSCPIASGDIDCGKTTVSLSGSTGSAAGYSSAWSTSSGVSNDVAQACSNRGVAAHASRPRS